MSAPPCLEPPIEEALQQYRNQFRRLNLPEWERGELLALFPDKSLGKATKTWKDPWPFGDRAGVYFVFDRDMKLLYIGKASMNSCMGARLSSWFYGPVTGTCSVQGQWSNEPFFVQTLAMPENMRFEAPALEEYLIDCLHPPENTAGRKR